MIIARFHGLVRNPLSGQNSGRIGDAYDPNSIVPWVFLECKHYTRHAAIGIYESLYDQVKKVYPNHTPPCVVALSEKNKHGFYVMMHSSDVIQYAVHMLELHGYTVTYNAPEEFDAAHDHMGDDEAVEGMRENCADLGGPEGCDHD